MDIGSGNSYPAAALSNFAPHPFVFDGVECNSMEGLLQSFKFSNPEMQKEVCKLVGKQAKFKGKKKKWYRTQTLYWAGQEYKRDSTCTAFDVDDNGNAAIAGCAMTRAYTTVIEETLTKTYGVFIGNKPCYMVYNATDEFYKDLAEKNMASLSRAKEKY